MSCLLLGNTLPTSVQGWQYALRRRSSGGVFGKAFSCAPGPHPEELPSVARQSPVPPKPRVLAAQGHFGMANLVPCPAFWGGSGAPVERISTDSPVIHETSLPIFLARGCQATNTKLSLRSQP